MSLTHLHVTAPTGRQPNQCARTCSRARALTNDGLLACGRDDGEQPTSNRAPGVSVREN